MLIYNVAETVFVLWPYFLIEMPLYYSALADVFTRAPLGGLQDVGQNAEVADLMLSSRGSLPPDAVVTSLS